MIRVAITKYDEDLVANAKKFLAAAQKHVESRVLLEKYGYSHDEHTRGIELVLQAERSFEWEREGRAYNFLSPTPERRVAEAKSWYADARRRHLRACLRHAEEAAGWVGTGAESRWPVKKKLAIGTLAALPHLAHAISVTAWRTHRTELAKDLERARAPKPADAPPPKDTVLVEIGGWYERWRLLAHRVMRGRPDLLAPYGLTPGKAPPRLRGKEARLKYGEGAAGTLKGAPAPANDDDDEEDVLADVGMNGIAQKPKSLPLVR